MARGEAVKATTQHRIRLCGRVIDYRVVQSKSARKMRVRVGPGGVNVVQPASRNGEEVSTFLAANGHWLVDQLERAERLSLVRRPEHRAAGEIFFRGEPTRVRIEATTSRAAGNMVQFLDGEIVVLRGRGSRTPVS